MAAKQPGSVDPQVVQKAARLYKEVNEIRERFFDLEARVHEHEIVIEALEPLDNSRKCCRLMGGVLVERTVGQVLPTIKDNKENLSQVRPGQQILCIHEVSANSSCRGFTYLSCQMPLATVLMHAPTHTASRYSNKC